MSLVLSLLLACSSSNEEVLPLPLEEDQLSDKVPPTNMHHDEPGIKQKTITLENIDNYAISLPIKKAQTYSARLSGSQNDTILALRKIIQQHALSGEDPWAIAHALLALGADAKLLSGEMALDRLFDFASIRIMKNRTVPYFPKDKKINGKTILIEPHKHLIAKVLTEIGIPPTYEFRINQTAFTMDEYYKGIVLSSYLNPYTNDSSYSSPDDMAWSVQALTTILKPHQEWEAENGQVMNSDQLSMFLVAVLAKETDTLKKSMAAGADFKKDGKGIFQYTCGGAHLLQGSAYAMARGFGNEATNAEIQMQIELLFYRFPRELKIYDALMMERPDYKIKLLVQRLKFVGHFLESAQKMAMIGLYEPTVKQIRMMHGAMDQIVLITSALSTEGVYKELYYLKVNDHQLYLDVLGDTCHALYAMRLFNGDVRIKY